MIPNFPETLFRTKFIRGYNPCVDTSWHNIVFEYLHFLSKSILNYIFKFDVWDMILGELKQVSRLQLIYQKHITSFKSNVSNFKISSFKVETKKSMKINKHVRS